MLAAIYLAGGDSKRAVALLMQASALDPRDFRPWFALGSVYHILGEMLQSRDAYTEALNRSPPAAEARLSRLGLVRALLDGHLDEDATADLDHLLQTNPEDPKALALAARQAISLGRVDEAMAAADRALATGEDDFDALLARARARFQTRSFLGAVEDLDGPSNSIRTMSRHFSCWARASSPWGGGRTPTRFCACRTLQEANAPHGQADEGNRQEAPGSRASLPAGRSRGGRRDGYPGLPVLPGRDRHLAWLPCRGGRAPTAPARARILDPTKLKGTRPEFGGVTSGEP